MRRAEGLGGVCRPASSAITRVVATMLVCFAPAAAHAQASGSSASVLVLPSAPASDTERDWGPATSAVAGALELAGASAWSPDAARTRFVEVHSREPSNVSLEDVNRWVNHSQAGIRHLAHGDYEAASEELEQAEQFMQGAADELNRQAERARKVLDTCLFIVRTMVEQGDSSDALQQALECRRLSPRIEPSPYVHTPETMEVLERADKILSDQPPAKLRVTSEPRGCTVRLNGVAIDQTPFVADDLAAGDYRVQVECGADAGGGPKRRGRVHRVRAGQGATRLHVDVRFDSTVRTDETLRLLHDAAQAEPRWRLHDAAVVLAAIDARAAILVTPAGGALRLDRIEVSPEAAEPEARVVASALVPAIYERRDNRIRPVPQHGPLTTAVEALREGRSVDVRSGTATSFEKWAPGRDAAPPETTRATADASDVRDPGPAAGGRTATGDEADTSSAASVTGLTLGAAGLVGLATSWGLWARLQARNDDLAAAFPSDVDYLSRQDRVDGARNAVLGVGVAAGALMTAAVPLALPARDGVPSWAWVIGGAGVALFGYGLVPFVAGDLPPVERDCIDENASPCTRRTQTRTLGALLWMHAAPMMAVPITYLVRGVTGGDATTTASVELAPGRLGVNIGGTF